MSIDTDYAVLRKVLADHKPEGWATEFGVYTGYSLGIIARHMPVIGFDSFEGLPEDWRPGFPKGKFRRGWKSQDLQGAQRMIVPGWFEDTVPTFPFPSLGLVHIDCDLYSSTITALEGVKYHIRQGTIIVFDEFHGYPGSADHEARAWDEWREAYQIESTLLTQGEQEAAFRIDKILGASTWP